MPNINVIFFQAEDGTVPFLEWFDELPVKAQDKCFVKLERLAECGHELRRPKLIIYAMPSMNCGSD